MSRRVGQRARKRQGNAQEYEVTYTISFAVWNTQQAFKIPKQQLSLTRDYIFDKTFDKIEEIIDIIKLESINDINSFY